MSSSNESFVFFINNATNQMNRYFSFFVFIFGVVGNILNILVLSQRSFRKNSCALLFLLSSIANLITILSGLTSRILSTWAADLTNTDRSLCKLRAFVLNVARPVAFWLILLAAIDRWLLSSENIRYRQMSSLENARSGSVLVVILSTILFCHILYCHEPNLVDAPLKCYGITLTCRFVTDTLFTLVSIVFPLLLMFLFGLLTINNVRKARGRVQHKDLSTVTNSNQETQRNRTEHYLLIMLLVQVLTLFIFGLPLGIQKLYATITIYRDTSKQQAAIDNFIYNLFLLMNLSAHGMPFYIYTLAGGSLFREAIFKLCISAKNLRCCRRITRH